MLMVILWSKRLVLLMLSEQLISRHSSIYYPSKEANIPYLLSY